MRVFAAVLVIAMILSSCAGKNEDVLRNSQVYYDTLETLEADKKVMVFLMDGLGYSQYEYALEHGKIPFISSLGEVERAEGYMPSISNVGLGALVTGQAPGKNGVKARGDMELEVDDIFLKARELQKKAILIEGDVKLINTSVEPVLNPDINGDGYTDDEVYNSVLLNIHDYDLIFVHFHGIDDASHTYGPNSAEALKRTSVIDTYVEEILESWGGAVIVSADHGQHENNGLGEHGTDREEDITVPYLYTD
jgi:predicted AlkP superfamily pyrophosphatase or phosphodiesterase